MDYTLFDAAVVKLGGRFKLSVLVQKRVRELVRGAAPLIATEGRFNPLDVALREVLEEKIKFEGDLDADLIDLEGKDK